uniref:Putative secreted protein n=1 Tax=Ixodes ricinus TaxID=34613 RepID=A0A6B0UP11_IXORI
MSEVCILFSFIALRRLSCQLVKYSSSGSIPFGDTQLRFYSPENGKRPVFDVALPGLARILEVQRFTVRDQVVLPLAFTVYNLDVTIRWVSQRDLPHEGEDHQSVEDVCRRSHLEVLRFPST